MSNRPSRVFLAPALLILALAAAPTWGQFGQNKISYQRFDWQVYQSPHFDVHYYPETEPFLEEIVSYAESAYLDISKILDHELRFRVPMIVYKTHGEFQQTNITLAQLPDGVGAFAEPVQYRMVLPIDLPPDKLYQLIAHELTHIFQYSYFFEGYLGRAIRARPPTWLMEGMASYMAKDEDNLDRMAIRDAVVNNILPPIETLNVVTFLTYRYGHAIFDFIEQEHGLEGLRSFLFEFKKVLLTGNLGKAIKESFGYDMDEFNRRFNRYLRQKYFPVLLEKKAPDDYGTALGTRKLKRAFTFSPTLSPSGELIAALSAPGLELDLVVLSAEDGSQIRNLTKGWTSEYRNLVTEVFAGKRDLSWSPTADHVAVFARKENKWPLLIFNSLTGKRVREITFDGIYQCNSPAFSPDGRRVAFEGNRDGVVDLFEVDLESGEVRNLTQDDFYDTNPWYGADGTSLLYNRRIGAYWKIFSVDLSDPSKKTQLSFGPSSDVQPSYSRDGSTVYFSSDRGEYGVFNLYALDLATGDIRQYTDVVGGCFAPVETAERGDERYLVFSAYFQGQFRLYRMPLRSAEQKIEVAERLEQPIEVEPFEPPLRLTPDEDKKARYKAKWDIEAPAVEVGVADDGTFLANAALQFTDLLGNQRLFVNAASVSDFQSYNATYLNLKHRFNWGANLYDYRDFFVDRSTGIRFERRFKTTGANMFYQYPLNRHYRVDLSAGVQDAGFNQFSGIDPRDGGPLFAEIEDTLGVVGTSFVGDTTRFQSFGPFQGQRFSIGVTYGPQISGDFDGNLLEYRLDFRKYKQLTRRSVLAWRVATRWGDGSRQNTYGFGGLNQLRGYDFREFFGSRIAWTNFELRFPLVDELRFPVLALRGIRGFFFFDLGAAWFDNRAFDGGTFGGDPWYDPDQRVIRADFADPDNPRIIPFKLWDSDENRLQDGRASYGWGFQFFFIGGLQFNWTWAYRLDHTQFVYTDPQTGDPLLTPVKIKRDGGGARSDFYIQYDW